VTAREEKSGRVRGSWDENGATKGELEGTFTPIEVGKQIKGRIGAQKGESHQKSERKTTGGEENYADSIKEPLR